MPLALDQLPLNLGLKDHALFSSFVAGDNAEVVDYLQNLDRATSCSYLWGAPGSGKSHCLQAVCHAAAEQNQATVYLPMQTLQTLSVDVLSGLESMAIICIDDIHLIAGQSLWEKALFRLFIGIDPNHTRLIVSANDAPTKIGIELSDLLSRLGGGVIFRLETADARTQSEALLLRAKKRGLNLSESVIHYLLRHFGDDMTLLFETLDKLDQASLAAKRRVTIPFIRQVVGER